jgi:hypothetical protein
MIGVELFGRRPSYDTGDDAIVRVTASDVRKRLQQHYSHVGSAAEACIVLPPGKYVPELVRSTATRDEIGTKRLNSMTASGPSATVVHTQHAEFEASTAPTTVKEAGASPNEGSRLAWQHWILPTAGGVALAVGIALAVMSWFGVFSRKPDIPESTAHSAPWTALFNGSRPLQIVASDPNIEEIQRLTQDRVELSDYANGHYLPKDANRLPPEQVRFITDILRGNKISTFDGDIIAGIVSLLPTGHPRPTIRGARDIRIQDIEANDNLIFLGSPRSNPWTEMYDHLLDFRFALNERTQREFVQNLRPLRGEQSEYVPTAGGFDTGESYATISLLPNSGRSGRVLIIAGTNGEGTGAAGTLIADPTHWDWLLKPCHLTNTGAPQSFQLLLQLGDMAGSAKDVKIIACHVLIRPS